MSPNFIIVGAARSGTTSLYQYCLEHPRVFMSAVKETNYFSSNPFGFTQQSYENLFEKHGDADAVGEASPSYLYDESAPRRIRESIPDCKIVMILRNPIERLISDFFYSQSWGANLNMDFSRFTAACLAGEGEGRQGFYPALMAKKGLYAEQVRRYQAVFPSERIFIRLHEDLRLAPGRLISDLYAFIGVDPTFSPAIARVHNGNSELVFPIVSRFVRRARRVEELLLDPLLPSTMKGRISNTILSLNRRSRTKESVRRSVNDEDRDRLVEFYRESVDELQGLIGRDVSRWLQARQTARLSAISISGGEV